VRVPLVRALPLPRLALTASDGTEIELFGIQPGGKGTGTGKVLLLQLFSPTCAPCVTELTNFAQQSAELTRAKLAPLAVSTTAHAERAAASELLARVGWPHPWASAAPQSLEVLDALVATLLDREQRLAVPVSFLIDPEGALRVLYLGPVEPAQVLSDVALCELGEGALFDRAAPFAGRWMFPGLAEDADLFEGRLRERGLEDAAAEFARGRLTVVRTTPADLLQDFARNSVAAGNLGEAEKYFRRALAGDPRHFGALFDLAVLLHKQERLQEASELYGKALALQPENADARFNLALVRIALGDRPGAERELRWLKAHGAESAEVLADVLANAK
jgi:tetratricopeptide (TPR) repeat protein